IIHLYELDSNGPQAAASAAVATTLLRLFALQVLCYGGVTLLTAALNARGSFAAPAFAPAVNNLVVIGVLLLVGASYGHRNLALAGHDAGFVLLLGLGTTAGVVAQLLTLLPALGRARIRLRWRWDPGNAAVRSILRLSGWTIGSVVANQVTLFVILTLAHGVNPDGGASAWTYAYTFFQLPFGIIAVSIMSVVQPELASSWALGRIGAFRRRLTAGLRATLGAVLPAAVGYLVLAGPIVDLVLEHGAARTGTASTGGLLAALALGLPGFSAYLYLTRAYQAMQDTRTVFVLYLVENAVNIVLAVVLAGPLGLVGLGLALSVAYTVAALLALWSLGRGGLGLTPHRVGPALGRLTPPCIAMAIAVLWVQGRVGGPAGVALVARVAASVGLGVSVFALVAVAGTVLVGARGARGAGSGRHRQRR
ncbi:MAG: murein biosynthesis integral membrane protein MurJ, partial [Acidimicrobiales bacterium]